MADVHGSGQPRKDWAAGLWSYLPAWILPKIAIIAAAFLPVPVRMVVWIVALAWMGAACLMNARRCGRVHCRYTGPYYLALTVPVALVGTGVIEAGTYAWIILGVFSVGGGYVITWATEAAWGRYEDTGNAP